MLVDIAATAVARATLLLTVKLKEGGDSRPLTRSEYHSLAAWLDVRGIPLAALLLPEARTILRTYPGAERILQSLSHVAEADALLEYWQSLGIWVLGERDEAFPSKLRQRLPGGCLPLLFGAGSIQLLDRGGLCVVGSRDCVEESLEFAKLAGARSAAEDIVVISSDMRGIDREVISAALAAGGRVICVLSDSFEKALTSKRYRDAIATGRATLVTPFLPDSRFAVANAMRVNRYQYGLSDAAIIVEARQSGGIWSGAEENRKHRWVPAFVRTGAEVPSANIALLHLGLLPITQNDIEQSSNLTHLLLSRSKQCNVPQAAAEAAEPPAPPPIRRGDLYSLFMSELALLDASVCCCEESIARAFGLEVAQATAWLARARREGRLAAGRLRPAPPGYANRTSAAPSCTFCAPAKCAPPNEEAA